MNVTGAGRHVVVIGGGIAGLAAAYALHVALPEARLTLVEESERLGGKLLTGELGGAPMETGADNWLARVPEATRLAEAVGLGSSLISPATGRAWVRIGGRLRPFPAGTVRGVPSRLLPLARSRVLSPAGFLRASFEPWLPGRPLAEPDTVGAIVARRLGRQVVDRLVDPLLGGVYAGHADALDLDAAAPDLAAIARTSRSLVRGVRRHLSDCAGPRDLPVFRSVRGGLTSYVATIATESKAEILLGARGVAIERLSGAFRVTLAGGRALIADGVVVAVPGRPAARLVELVAPAAAASLRELAYASVALVGLAYPSDGVRVPSGAGVLVPAGSGIVKAVTFYDQKWPDGATDGVVRLRASVGRAGEPVDIDDEQLVSVVHAELAAMLPLPVRPIDAFVARWSDALPQYVLGHQGRVAAIESAVSDVPGLAMAGAAYGGVGIAACIRSAEAAAGRVVEHVRSRG